MPTTCKIYFDNNEQIYHSGQKVNITVRLKLTQEIKFRNITLHLRGKTHVGSANSGGSYTADENVLDMKKYLVYGNDGEIQHLMPGTYDYSFQYTLPNNLPSSYSDWQGWGYTKYTAPSHSDYGGWGHTKYTAQVTINIPRWLDKTFKRNFIVYKSLDLNDFESLQSSVTYQKEATVELDRISASSGGPFNFLARLDSGGYVSGQIVNVECEVENNDSNYAIHSFRVKLVRKITFFKWESNKHKKTTYAQLDEKTARGCQQRQRTKFTVILKVPRTPPTDTDSNLITFEYEIWIFGWMGPSHCWRRKHPSITIPITIGTRPIQSSVQTEENLSDKIRFPPSVPPLPTEPSNAYLFEASAPQQSDDDTVSIRTYTSTPPPFPDDELDLPTYDEAMLLNLDEDFDFNPEHMQNSFAQL